MICPQCNQATDERSAFCPHCGVRLAGGGFSGAPEAADDPTYAALAQANLMRLRGNWDGARERTVEVLRDFPNNGTAHSVMGDIYSDQEQYEEAAQWYRMALELEPDNAADARKLAQVEARLREQQAAMEEPPERPPHLSPLVLVGWAAATFLVVVIALGLWINSQRPGDEPPVVSRPAPLGPQGPGPAPRQGPVRAAPARPTPGQPGQPGPTAQQGQPGQNRQQGQTGSTGQTQSRESVAASEIPSRPAPEAHLAQVLDGLAPSLSPVGLAVSGVLYDPRDASATITLDGARVDGTRGEWMLRVHEAALHAARTVLEKTPALQRVTVRLEMPLRDGDRIIRDLAFIGDLVRSARAPTAFDERWWHPGLVPPPGLASTVNAP